jgi:hypothetical protein
MSDIPKPQGDVLRRNTEAECGTPIGQMNIKIHGLPGFQTVSFYCNRPRLHTDQCEFLGSEILVKARRREGQQILIPGNVTPPR